MQQYSKGIQYPKNTRRINKLYEKRRKQVNHFIHSILQEESYSSQCSPNSVEVSRDYAEKGNRKYRGLYKESNKIYNVDCVGAYNILRKYLCRIEKSYPAVVGLDTPVMYRWNSMSFNVNTKLSILMEM